MTIIGEAMKRQGLSTAVVAERAGYSWWLVDRLAHDEALLARATLVQIGSVCEAVGLEPVEVMRVVGVVRDTPETW